MSCTRLLAGVSLACVIALTACGPQPQELPYQATLAPATSVPPATPDAGYPAPATPADTGYPAPADAGYPAPNAPPPTAGPSDPAFEGRDMSALESYEVALEFAEQEFGPVQLYAIVPSHIMLQNFGNPPVELGWFYKFKSPDDPAFHFVQVVDGRALGARSLTPLGEDEPQQPLDVATVTLDSPEVFERFRERAPELGITIDESLTYDLELVQLPGNPAPIWSVVTPDGSRWLYSLNAVTGEETADPRQ